MVDRVIDLVGDELHAALRAEIVQAAHVGLGQNGAGRIMRRIDQHELG